MAENSWLGISNPSLNFGVEMETLYVHQLSEFEQQIGIPTGPGYHSTARQRREYVASILQHKLPVGNRIPSILGPVNVDDDDTSYTTWTVTDDSSIGASADEISKRFHIPRSDVDKLLHWDQIELVSPVFHFRSTETWFLQLRQIQADIASRRHLGASLCNESCALHVHFSLEAPPEQQQEEQQQQDDISDSKSDFDAPAFPLPVLKNLVILWAFWEKSIESFHPFYRHGKRCTYALSLLSSTDALRKHGVAGFNLWTEWAEQIYSLDSSEDIRDFLGPIAPKFVKIYISPARGYKKETIEFREHRGTTNAMEIRWWVVFIERVIQYAWRTAQANFRFFAPGSQLWNVHNTEDIWHVIEMPQEGRDYLREKIHEYANLNLDDFYPPSSSGGTDLAGS